MEEDAVEWHLERAELVLSQHAREELRQASILLRVEENSNGEFARYFARWKEFIGFVEVCYEGESTEYLWELTSRYYIHLLSEQVDAETREAVDRWLRELDMRFMKATRQVAQRISPRCRGGWWCYRVPLRYSEYLERTLPITDE